MAGYIAPFIGNMTLHEADLREISVHNHQIKVQRLVTIVFCYGHWLVRGHS